MADQEAADLLKAAAEATSGPGTPDAAIVTSKPSDTSLRFLALSGPALSAMIGWIVVAIAGCGLKVFWILQLVPVIEWPEQVAEARIQGLMAVAMSLCAILGVVVFRLASGNMRRAEVKVGPAGITLESGDGSS